MVSCDMGTEKNARPPDLGLRPEQAVLVLDFGAQYAQLIARRIREARVFSEIVPGTTSCAAIAELQPAAIVLSGGPASVYSDDAPVCDPGLFELGVPVLGICYGHQLMAQALGGRVDRTGAREYGATTLRQGATSVLLEGMPPSLTVWMSHADAVVEAPRGFAVTAATDGTPVAAMEDARRRLVGTQFHPEVTHTEHGQDILRRFLFDVADLEPTWTTVSIVESETEKIRQQVGSAKAVCALSGGVDSAVAATLVHRAIGDQLTCLFVDHGLLRQGESDQVCKTYRRMFGKNFVRIDAADQFIGELKDRDDPEEKRKIIGETFINVFREYCENQLDDIRFLVQGTIYSDWIESGGNGAATSIKSHHNVGGLPEDLHFELVEPLRDLFKDEVRLLGTEIGLPDSIVWRQPFPGPGLAVRIVGKVDHEKLDILRAADAIIRDEVHKHEEIENRLWQVFAVLLDVKTVGVQGDNRTYAYPIVLRAVESEDAMTAEWARLPHELLGSISRRVVNEVEGVNRVVYDITSKPPGTIEWE